MREWLTEIREKAGLTQAAVAKAAEISQPSYSAIERGEANPKIQNAKRIGMILGFRWDRFYEDELEDRKEGPGD